MPNTGNYSYGKIYRLISDQTDDIYIGSTSQRWLSSRLSLHRSHYKKWLDGGAAFTPSFEILKFDDCRIVLIENYPCCDRYELESRERYHIENTKCVNKHVPTRTQKEYYKQNIEKIRAYRKENNPLITKQQQNYYAKNREMLLAKSKEYYNENKDKLTEYSRQWYHANKECVAERSKIYRNDNKEKIQSRQKQYRIENGARIKEKEREYRLKNKEKIKINKRQKVICEVCCACVAKLEFNHIRKHKSANHI